MSYHRDHEVNEAIVKLLDALCSWERDTRSRSTFILIPHDATDRLILAQDGKPLDIDLCTAKIADRIYVMAFQERKRNLMGNVV